jgi:hypothetical protein
MFVKKPSIPETGIIPESVLTIQYRIGNTNCEEPEFIIAFTFYFRNIMAFTFYSPLISLILYLQIPSSTAKNGHYPEEFPIFDWV